MTSSTRRLTRWAVAAAGALTMGLLGVAAPAAATPNLDPNGLGSITIHKFAEPATPTELAHDGTVVDTTGLTPLEGVTFTARQVTSINLGTNAGWDMVDELDAAKVNADPVAYPLGVAVAGTTADGGTTVLSKLPVGVYLVTETSVGTNPIAVKAAPFLVSIPLPTQQNTWLYDLHVYPKNSVTSIDKTVDDSAAFGLGDVVPWTVTVDVPELAEADALTRFGITDKLDSRLGFRAVTISVLDAAGDAVTLVPADYALTRPTVGTHGEVALAFTADGLAKLRATSQGGTVALTIDTTVLSIGDGTIENEAAVFVNDYDGVTKADTSWGALKIVKFAQVGSEVKRGEVVKSFLSGAEFQVFRTFDDADRAVHPVTVDGQTTFTTGGPAGDVLIKGLKAGTYWIVETEAPTGYVGVDAPIEVIVAAGAITEPAVYQVENDQRPPFELPLTGAAGTVLFSIFGLGLIAVAAGAAMRHRSRATLAA